LRGAGAACQASPIQDDRAVQFAITFYRQLANGDTVQRAFDLAGLPLGESGGTGRPRLLHAAGVDPAKVVFGIAHED
jgi:hypothetical protein